MNAVKITELANVSLINSIEPQCGNGDVLVKMESCGICGSDLGNIFGNSCRPSTKLGHEIAGTIVEKGSQVDDFNIGDRVFVHHHTPCNDCHYCKHGNQTMCEKFVECLEPCGLAEKFLIPQWNIKLGSITKIPNTMSFEEASLIEPLACCIRSWKKCSFSTNDSVVIFGVGPIGVMHAMLAKHYGFGKIFCVEPSEFRRNFCKEHDIGITIKGDNTDVCKKICMQANHVDLVIIATSQMTVFHSAIKILRKGGTILLFGEPNEECKLKIDFNEICSKEISIIPSYAASNEDVKRSFDLINKKLINVRQLITD